MFWILRRTGAASFFNSLNGNCNTSKGNANSRPDKYAKRPPRKAYGLLSADSDDAASAKHKIDDPFEELEHFEIRPTKGKFAISDDAHRQDGAAGANCNGGGSVCGAMDCQGNFIPNDLCDVNRCSGSKRLSPLRATPEQKEVNENTINRLQTMAMSDDDDYDEALTCNVCDRAFHCQRQLASHQQKKRHFGCSGCDSLFPSLMLLEHHKEEFEHWSDEELSGRVCCRRNRGDDYFTDTDSFTSDAESEDLERLL